MRRATFGLIAALLAAAPVNAQVAWWTPVSVSPEISKAVWWVPPCECGNCGNDAGQKAEYTKAYDKAIKEGKPLVLFVGQPLRKIDDAICVRFDGADLPLGTKSPAVVIGRGCNGLTMNRTALLPGEPTDRAIMESLRQQPVCPTCPNSPQRTPFRIGAAEPELNGVAGLLAAAMIGVVEGVDDAKKTTQTAVVPASFAAPFVGSSFSGGDAVYFEARRRFAPVRRLLSLPFRAIRSARANRVEPVPGEQPSFTSATVTRYEAVSQMTFQPFVENVNVTRLRPVTESVPVTRYRLVETAMPPR